MFSFPRLRQALQVLLVLLVHLDNTNAAAQNISRALLGWSSNSATLHSCLKTFSNTTTFSDNSFYQSGPYYYRRDLDGLPSTKLLHARKVSQNTGLDFPSYGYFIKSDENLCKMCSNQNATFTPTRNLSSYTPGWPEIVLSMINACIAMFTADRYPLKPFAVVYASIAAILKLGGAGWALWHFVAEPGSAPWLTGDGWVILLVAFFKIQMAMKRLQERDMFGVKKKGREPVILVCYVGMAAAILIGVGTLVIVMLGILKTDLHLWEKAYDLHSSIPAVCEGTYMNGYMPSTYHAMALRFLTAEVVFSWLLFLFLATYYLYARSGGDMFEEGSLGVFLPLVCLIGWFFILKPIEIAKTVQHGQLGNVVQSSGNCCIVLPTQLWGGMIDNTGRLVGVLGRFFAML